MTGQRPRVSVLMTIYNAEPYLKEAIDSIVVQSFGDWELIAVENGSSDRSRAILDSYQDSRIRAFCLPENIGRTPALRHAFDQARGEYMAVLDADDVAHPERFKKQVNYLDQHAEVGLVGSWAEQIKEHGEFVGVFSPPVEEKKLSDTLGWSNPFVHSSIMYRASVARQVHGYPEEYIYAQDYALILRIENDAKVAMIPEPLCKWRVPQTSMTRSAKYSLVIAKELYSLGEIAAKRNFFCNESRQRSTQRQAVAQLKLGLLLIKNNNFLEGMRYAAIAIMRKPACLIFNGYAGRLFGWIK